MAEERFGHYTLRGYRGSKVVRDVVWGMIDLMPHELAFVDSPVFQRLRNIYQTSLAFLTYPSAVHSRFEHSLGALSVTDRVLRALDKRTAAAFTELDLLEARLSALLHDSTHGPLSHTSEAFYKADPIFREIKATLPKTFKNASASEILTYCFLTSDYFGRLWEQVVHRYERRDGLAKHLTSCDRWRIATMIVGADYNDERPEASPGPKRRFLRQLINGPIDVDKLDYIARDGYFTGLNLGVDVERLLWVLDTIELREEGSNEQSRVLCVSASGAIVLEQVLFSKMQLFSSLYHHHKVRVAHQALLRLLASLRAAGVKIKGLPLEDPASFVFLRDDDILHGCFEPAHGTEQEQALRAANRLVSAIAERRLPMRALVLTYPAWGKNPREKDKDDNRAGWANLIKANDQPSRLAGEIAKKAGVSSDDIWIDDPDPVNLQGTGREGLVKFDEHTAVPISEMFPIGGWLSAYQSYRSISYIFSFKNREAVARAAREILAKEYNVTLNDVAVKYSRIEEGPLT
jgi:HD superfamily phosphohydrolase